MGAQRVIVIGRRSQEAVLEAAQRRFLRAG